MKQPIQSVIRFMRREVVLTAAVLLALLSSVFVGPANLDLSYIDWNTLALLFGLMAVMKGFQKAGMFLSLGSRLLEVTSSTRSMLAVLVFLPFVCSMVITNDVSLITFVPFGIAVLKIAGQEKLVVPMAVLQTAAANLGSMFTPMGNPQNLYLYGKSGMGFLELCGILFPYVLASGLAILLLIVIRKPEPVKSMSIDVQMGSTKMLVLCFAGFAICLLGIFKLLPPLLIAAVIAAFLLAFDRELLLSVDYSLLGTFLAFFIFIGNVSGIESFQAFLSAALAGREVLVSVLASQVISNVPAALLLSGFTSQWESLLIGCNLGGLGTLIASMASLISYKLIAQEYPEQKGTYFFWFTVCNVGLLALLLALYFLLEILF